MQKNNYIYYINHKNKKIMIYLSEINKLTPYKKSRKELTDEEIELQNSLHRDEEYNLWQQMRHGNMKAREELINRNLLYVVSVAKRYAWDDSSFQDMVMAGNVGLVKAADTFDASLGTKFISYATWYVEYEIKKMKRVLKHANENCSDIVDRYAIRPKNDWCSRYYTALEALKQRLENHMFKGADQLLTDYIEMMKVGYSTTDFKRKHHLTDRQMDYFLNLVFSEGRNILRDN